MNVILKIPLLNKQQYQSLDELLMTIQYKHIAGKTCDYIQLAEHEKKKIFVEAIKTGIQFEEVQDMNE